MALSEADLQNLYAWIDDIPMSRPKRNFSRDFSDGGETLSLRSAAAAAAAAATRGRRPWQAARTGVGESGLFPACPPAAQF